MCTCMDLCLKQTAVLSPVATFEVGFSNHCHWDRQWCAFKLAQCSCIKIGFKIRLVLNSLKAQTQQGRNSGKQALGCEFADFLSANGDNSFVFVLILVGAVFGFHLSSVFDPSKLQAQCRGIALWTGEEELTGPNSPAAMMCLTPCRRHSLHLSSTLRAGLIFAILWEKFSDYAISSVM